MYPYQDKDRPLDERVEDLLARMTTEEKILQTDLYAATDFSTRIWPTRLARMPSWATEYSSSSLLTMPPPVPPRV